MMHLLIITVLVATYNAEFASSKIILPVHGRIIGGENTTIEFHQHQVSIHYDGKHECAGSIISKNYVITAAHCITPHLVRNITVRAGTSFRDTGGSVHKLGIFKLHENYTEYEHGVPVINDIAVFKVKPLFNFDRTRRPIELFEEDEQAKAGAISVVTGWGCTQSQCKEYPDQLKKVTLPIISKSVCKKAYKKLVGTIPEGQICAGYMGVGDRSSCTGDSGGPLTIGGKLAGIVSWSHEDCANPKYPAVYTEIAYYRDWIRKNTKI